MNTKPTKPIVFNPLDILMLTEIEDIDLTKASPRAGGSADSDNQPTNKTNMKEITIEEQNTLDSLVRKLIKAVHEDATESDLDCLVDDFHDDFINNECRAKLEYWNNACQTNNQ